MRPPMKIFRRILAFLLVLFAIEGGLSEMFDKDN